MTAAGPAVRFGMLAASCALVLSACAASPAPPLAEPAPASSTPPSSAPPALFTLPAEGRLDYRLGGASPPPPGVTLVVRDATEPPAPGVTSLCHINGFQPQPGELDNWLTTAPEAVLRDAAGEPLIDPGWPDHVLAHC